MVLHPSGALAGALDAPPSKSATNRLLPIAALADGRSLLRAPLDSDDSAAMRTCLRQLGARVDERSDDGLDSKSGPEWSVTGTHGRLRTPDGPLDAQLSGTTMRFLAALATIVPGGAQITGASPLLRRPIGSLTAALGALGAGIEDTDGRPPVRTRGGGLAGGEVTVDVTGSSQFASAVLLVAPYAERDVTVSLAGPSATDYITLTVEAMRQWGAEVADVPDGGWHVTAGAGYRAREVDVEHDASAAAHLLALAAATGGRVTVRNASPGSRQPDAAVPSLLAAMGCRVEREGTALTVQGPARLAPLDADLGAMPDQVTTMAVLAALADGESRLSGVAVARTHETDRLAALATELGKLGIAVVEEPGALVIRGGTGRGPARLATYDDHRLAMAFASLGAVIPGITIEDPACVTKTYPAFWADAGRLGLRWAPEPETPHAEGSDRDVESRPVTVVVAIDGPGGAGKSTIAASLAERLGVPHVDTGAFYRAATLAAIEARVDLDDGVACAEVVANAHIERRGDRTILGAQDVEDAIRGPQVTAHVSRVAAHAEVRAALLDLQRAGIDLRGGVVEGRDAGTAVVPDADLKIWLTASPQARAVRRAGQLGETDPGAIAEMGADLSRRDAADAAQMDRAADAVVVDTTGRDVPDLVTELEARVRSLADAGCS